MVVLEVMITLHPQVVVKIGCRELEKGYEIMTWLHCVVETTPEYCIVSCIVLFAKTGYVEWRTFLYAWINGSGNQKTSNVMDNATLSIVIAYSFINDCM